MNDFFRSFPAIRTERVLLKRLTEQNADGLQEMVSNNAVYRYEPTFLYEKKYDDVHYTIKHLYDECISDSLILGIFVDSQFCGLAELYGFRDDIHKVSIGYRLSERFWGKGIASEALSLIVDYLYSNTDIEIITSSSMIENTASAKVLRKNGFELVSHGVPEDWGYEQPVIVDKWIR